MGPAKLEKAVKLNIPIISETDFMKLINETEIRNVISKVYELLPTPVRLVLPREMIINKILKVKTCQK